MTFIAKMHWIQAIQWLLLEPNIHLVSGSEGKPGEEIGTTNELKKEEKLLSDELETNTLEGSSRWLQSYSFLKVWSDALIPNIRPSGEILYDPKPKVNSFLLGLVQRGIEVSLNNLEEELLNGNVVKTDFSVVEEIFFTRTGPNIAKRDFSFCIHAPMAFHFFRELLGISIECFRNSLCKEPLTELSCSSQSGMIYATYDDRFIIKKCHKKEAAFLESFFPGYFANMTKYPKTLLPKFFGLYGYKVGKKHVHFLIMNNLVPIFVDLHETYDLKGSTYSKRKFKSPKASIENHKNYLCSEVILKDLDFLERLPDGLYLEEKLYLVLMQSIERDCRILQAYDIIDYSLLLGIHVPEDIYWKEYDYQFSSQDPRKKTKPEIERMRKINNLIGPFEARTSIGQRVHLYLGIIDILRSYTIAKKCEHFLKSMVYSPNTMSVVKPTYYAERFSNFLKQSVLKCIPELIPLQKAEMKLMKKLLEDFPDDIEM